MVVLATVVVTVWLIVTFATVCVVEVVSLRYSVTVALTFPEACGIYGALTFSLSVEEWVALLTVISAGSVEFLAYAEVTFVVLVSVVFWGRATGDAEVMVEFPS